MKVKSEIQNLNKDDLFSLILFTLYQLTGNPEYTVSSELAYVLDRKNFLRLCEYFGGITIRIPTISEIEELTCALLVYQFANIDQLPLEEALKRAKSYYPQVRDLKSKYAAICNTVDNYNFNLNKYHVDRVKEHL